MVLMFAEGAADPRDIHLMSSHRQGFGFVEMRAALARYGSSSLCIDSWKFTIWMNPIIRLVFESERDGKLGKCDYPLCISLVSVPIGHRKAPIFPL